MIIMTGYDEPLMQLEASRYSAQFIKKPIKTREFLDVRAATACRRFAASGAGRVSACSAASASRRPAARRQSSTSATVVSAWRFPQSTALPALFDVEVSGINLHLMVEPVWSSARVPGALVCGAALASDATPAARTWREIVDRLSA